MSRQRRFIVLISAGSHVSPTSQAVIGNTPCKATQPAAISAPQNGQSMAAKHHMPVRRIALGLSVRNDRREIEASLLSMAVSGRVEAGAVALA